MLFGNYCVGKIINLIARIENAEDVGLLAKVSERNCVLYSEATAAQVTANQVKQAGLLRFLSTQRETCKEQT